MTCSSEAEQLVGTDLPAVAPPSLPASRCCNFATNGATLICARVLPTGMESGFTPAPASAFGPSATRRHHPVPGASPVDAFLLEPVATVTASITLLK